MRLILRWRRIGNVFCFFVATYGLLIVWRDPGLRLADHALLAGSLLAFIVAAQIAMTLLTVLLRK